MIYAGNGIFEIAAIGVYPKAIVQKVLYNGTP